MKTKVAKPRAKQKSKRVALGLAGYTVQAGNQASRELPVARLVTNTWLSLPVSVCTGNETGRVFASAPRFTALSSTGLRSSAA